MSDESNNTFKFLDDAQSAVKTTTYGMRDYCLRMQLVAEPHARPFEIIETPQRISHIAVMTGGQVNDFDRNHVAKLCRHFGVPTPAPGINFFSQKIGNIKLRWERHTEFSSFTFYGDASSSGKPFQDPIINYVPRSWLEGMPGEVIVAFHVELERSLSQTGRSLEELRELYADNYIVGGQVAHGAARVWTDFRTHEDGFGRILVSDINLVDRQSGRLIQRLIELETYRMMALLALPFARRITPDLAEIDQEMAQFTQQMTSVRGLKDENRLLDHLSRLAAKIEKLVGETNYRFTATEAYYEIVQSRLKALKEEKIGRYQTLDEFIERRMAPAMRTCSATKERLETLSKRIARSSNLLRARVDVALEAQNRDLLRSMNQRARLQLRLQETVEGLSVVFISYYIISLVSYLLSGVKAAGLSFNKDIVTGILLPVIVLIVFFMLRKMKRSLAHRYSYIEKAAAVSGVDKLSDD